MPANYEYSQVQARVQIAGFGQVEATNISVMFGINTFPTASVELAVGRAADGGGAESPGVYSLQMYRREIQIDFSVGQGAATVFKGYVTRVSSVKSSGRFGVVVTAISWHSDLTTGSPFATGLSRNAAEYDLETPIALPSFFEGEASKISQDGLRTSVENLVQGGSYGAAMLHVAGTLTQGTSSGVPVSNSAAAKVLGATTANLTLKTGAPAAAISGLANTLSSSMYTVFNGRTLWEAMLSHTVELSYVIVPTVSSMFIIPWVPISSSPSRTLSVDQIVSASNTFGIQPTVQTLALYQQESMGTIGGFGGTTLIKASYTNPNVDSGMLDVAPIPSWLTGLISSQATTKTMSLSDGIRSRAKQSGAQASRVAEGDSVENISDDVKASAKTLEGAAKAYAQFLYGLRAITGTAIIQVPLDSTIGPASTVRFDLGDKIGKLDGYINTVTYTIDSERHMAVQQLTVTHMRSPTDSAAIGVASSPIWAGAAGGVDVIGNSLQ